MSELQYRKWVSFLILLVALSLWFVVLSIALVFTWGPGWLAFFSGLAGALIGAAFVHFLYQVI